MFEQVEEARAGRGGKVLSEKDISKVNYGKNLNINDYCLKDLVSPVLPFSMPPEVLTLQW